MPILPAPTLAAPPCAPAAIRVTTGARDGDFSGMSHGGTLVILTNRGRFACSLPGLPTIALRDAHGRMLPAIRRAPVGMHPGPVVRPVILRPGERASTGIRWVSGPVYDASRCYDARSIRVRLGRGGVNAPLRAHLCGPGNAAPTFDQPVLTRDRPAR